ncbi:MAG: DUF4398 domain-containing protein [Chitinivibrionales bacterium]|nr:DUF4398 domain-containing protein [Chitinivibrionales bacterium]MBD3394077.1 DUF4398 domain-containing protein [Chitinivibrionales bacterium]
MRPLNHLIPVVLAGTCILGLLSGCAKAPVEELARAKAAIQAAQEAEADKYMPNNFDNVQKALSAADAEIAVQNEKFALSRDYRKAKRLLSNTTELATQMKVDAPEAKVAMTEQVEANLSAAREIAEETAVDIKKAPRSKGRDVLAQMRVDLDEANSAIDKAAGDFDAGDIPAAARELEKARRLFKKISDRLSTGGTDGLM